MAEKYLGSASFVVKLQVGGRTYSIPWTRAIVGTKGIFLRNIQLAVGTPVVVEICKEQIAVTIAGNVCGNCPDLGLAVEFTTKTERVEQKLATLLMAGQFR